MDTGDITTGAAVQQFCGLAQSAKGKAAAALVQQALSHPSVYVFEELLNIPSIQQLAEGADKPVLELLKIFAYGTYTDYKANVQALSLPQLTPNQDTKLKKLTIVSLSSENRVIPYTVLLQQLDMNNVRELEDLIIDCIYQGIIKGRLDQKSKQLQVDFAIGRDLRPGQLETMIATLLNWNQKAEVLLSSIQEKMQFAQVYQQNAKEKKKEFDDKLEAMKASVMEHQSEFAIGVEYEEEARRKKGPGRKGARKGGPKGHDSRSNFN